MSLEMRQESVTPGALDEHGRISIAFMVDRILEVTLADGGMGGISLTETRGSPGRHAGWRRCARVPDARSVHAGRP